MPKESLFGRTLLQLADARVDTGEVIAYKVAPSAPTPAGAEPAPAKVTIFLKGGCVITVVETADMPIGMVLEALDRAIGVRPAKKGKG